MLRDIPLFSCLDDDALREVEGIAVKREFAKNAVIFSKGDVSDSLYVVCRGKVKAVIHDEMGKEIVLSVIGKGECFGEMAALDGVPRSATIVTKEASEIVILHRDDFRRILSSNMDTIFKLLSVLLDRLRRADEKIESLAFWNVHARIANLLMELAQPEGSGWVIREKMTHQEIADIVGSSRERVSKILKEISDAGYITIDRKRIRIHKKLA
jgi:CRP/FNR family cyclic AMP-dependent transcriptional regulator